MEPIPEASDEYDSLFSAEHGRTRSVNSEDSEVYHSTTSRFSSNGSGLTTTGPVMTSGSGDWDSRLKKEGRSGFVTLNPISLFLAFRRAKILTVEPVIFLYMFATYLYFPLYTQYFYLEFAKQVIGNTSVLPNGTYCLTANETDELGGNGTSKKVETLTSYMSVYNSLANQLPSIIFTLIYGPLSDRFGRRPVMLIVAFGSILQGLLAMGIVHWNLSVYFFLLPSALAGISGDFAAILMSCFAYVSDVSSAKSLTFRIGFAEAMLFMAGALAEGTGGLWFQKLNCNFLPPITLFIGCNALLIAYVLLFLPESLTRKERERNALGKPKGLAVVIRGFKIYFCQVKEYSVWILWASLIAIFVLVMTSAGSQRISVLFLKADEPFDWLPTMIGYYQMTSQLSHMLGLLVILPIMVALKLPDALISLIGLAFSAGMNIFTGLAKQTFEMFIIAGIQGVEAIVFPPLRSIQSKAVDKADQGALFSVIASAEVGATLASGLIFPIVIPLALNHGLSPGVAYLLMASLCIIPLIMLLLLLFFRKRKRLCSKNQTESPTASKAPMNFSSPDFTSTGSETDSLLAPGYRNTYPSNLGKRQINRTGVRSLN